MQVEQDAARLAERVREGVRAAGDPSYVAGTVAARSPGKPVLGVRIPLLRAAVTAAVRPVVRADLAAGRLVVGAAADLLWSESAHEDELAACMALRLARVPGDPGRVRTWAPGLDNWLSVDELGGVVGRWLAAGEVSIDHLRPLAAADSPWQRRLYLVSLIAPVRAGLDPVAVPDLAPLLFETTPPVRKAACWLVSSVLKTRPAAAGEFAAVLGDVAPRPLARLLASAAG